MFDREFDVFHEQAFGQFELETARVGAGPVEDFPDLVNERMHAKLARAAVHRQGKICFVRGVRARHELPAVVPSTQWPSRKINPLSSASGTKIAGDSGPPGCIQRTTASAPIVRPPASVWRWYSR